jgi:hypothetical protein
VIAADELGTTPDEKIDDVVGIRTKANNVSRNHDLADTELVELGQNGAQGNQVSVNVR